MILRGAQLIDGSGRAPIPAACVAIREGRIVYVGPSDRVPQLSDDVSIDLHGCTLLPGLIDAHTHLGMDPGLGNQPRQWAVSESELAMRSAMHMRRDFLAGVTTLRSMGEKHFVDVTLRRLVQENVLPGPRLLLATRGLRASNGHGASPLVVDGADNIRQVVRENLNAGADVIKVYMSGGLSSANAAVLAVGYTNDELRAAVDEATRAGKPVAAHAHGGPAVDMCLDIGVHSIEHGAFLSPEQVEAVAKAGTWIVLTLGLIVHEDGLMRVDGHNPELRERILMARERLEVTVRSMIQAGIRLAVGTDGRHGMLAFEAECLVRFGLSPLEAIVCTTRNGAEVCGVLGDTGTLEVGKMADVIAVEGDPLADIQALRKVRLLVKSGVRYDHLSSQ
jgi:imidazolonepropionase-like amidohydrolase